MAKLKAYVFEVESSQERDDDKIRENLEAIDGVTSVEYCPSYWGAPCIWTVTFEPPEQWKGMEDTIRRVDRAVLARKAKKGRISKEFGSFVKRREQEAYADMMAHGGPFGNVTFISDK